jgi:hypothetical protein
MKTTADRKAPTMSVRITHRRMSGGTRHEHISAVKWENEQSNERGSSTREDMVKWIHGGGKAWVRGAGVSAQVLVVQAHPPYLRTWADGRYTDNLLALPEF